MANDTNVIVLVGRLTASPELRSTNSGTYLCRFTLASNREIYKKDSDNIKEVGFFDCIAWAGLGEMISKNATKGKRVCVNGRLRWSSWDNSEGKKQSKVEINVDSFQFLDNRQSSGEQTQSTGNASASNTGVEPEPFSDNIPF